MLKTCIERIKPGVWFKDSMRSTARKMMKIQDILPSGYHSTLLIYSLTDKRITSDFAVNAIDSKGIPCCCPYAMEIFYVKSEADLYSDGLFGPTTRHVEGVME